MNQVSGRVMDTEQLCPATELFFTIPRRVIEFVVRRLSVMEAQKPDGRLRSDPWVGVWRNFGHYGEGDSRVGPREGHLRG